LATESSHPPERDIAMASSEPGAELGHYRIVRLLGRGGMGDVYLARDLKLERDVAIKLLPADGPDHDDTRKRLLHEAQAAAALDHPHICSVHEVGETDDGRAFIVMQYVEGETLAAVLRRGPLPVRDALALGAQIAEALAVAHKRGIVHRDLKPQNVMVTPSGRPKLLDFGLAKLVHSAPPMPDADVASGQTLAGIVKGTPAYMSPEQVQLRPVDGRSDLFALGAVLFECLTGRRAFDGASTSDVFGQILREHPPPVSSLRSGLQDRHDELCRRLLAKDPADRFQSAEEVIGAVRLLIADSSRDGVAPGTFRTPPAGNTEGLSEAVTISSGPGTSAARLWQRPRVWLAVGAGALVLATAAAAAFWTWNAARALASAPPAAARWYQRGAEAIREGAYHSGQRALEEAIRLFPEYPIAHARLAEALAELDDERGAQTQLLRLSSVLPDESRLPEADRLRLQGTRALVLRDLEASVAAYKTFVERNPGDAPAWLDLGRVQEAAGRRVDARASYLKAVQIDPQYAAARLRLGSVEGDESRRDDALRAFAEAERLYRAAANTEGEAEVLLRRGALRYVTGDLREARTDLERALGLASTLKGTHQAVRAQMALSAVTAAEGRFTESERIAATAAQQALDAGLDTVAADGLLDLTATLMESGRLAEAAAQGERAIQLAERRGAKRTAARARIQLAAVRLQERRPKEALALADGAVSYLKPNNYRRLELFGLSVMSRAYQQLDDLERARAISTDVVAAAEAVHDEVQVGIALSNLASVATALGQFPQALAHRERAEAIRRRQNDASALPYDLANRAELLICLGRFDDAARALDELEAGINAGIDAYVGRARRAAYLRGLAAMMTLQLREAMRRLRSIQPSGGGDDISVLAPVLARYAQARLARSPGAGGRAAMSAAAAVDPTPARERQYWLATAALEQGSASVALAEAERGLAFLGEMSNDELRWRLAAVGTLALRAMGEAGRAREMRGRVEEAFARLRSGWPHGLDTYERRPDLAELRARIGPA
jgi:tetratricopeptide (TPR) repeat protein/predicted Ser/Thr protein kinase